MIANSLAIRGGDGCQWCGLVAGEQKGEPTVRLNARSKVRPALGASDGQLAVSSDGLSRPPRPDRPWPAHALRSPTVGVSVTPACKALPVAARQRSNLGVAGEGTMDGVVANLTDDQEPARASSHIRSPTLLRRSAGRRQRSRLR